MAEKRITPNLDFRGTYPAPGRIGHTPERVKQNDLDPVKFNEYERVLMEIAEFIGNLDLEFVHDYIAPAQQRPDNIGDAFRTIWSALNGAKYDKSGGLIAGDLDVGGTTHLLGVLSVDDDVVLQKDIDIYGLSRFHDTADFRSITMLWKTGINYRKDEIVRYADGLYMCTEAHLSGSSFEYDGDYWISIGGGGAGGSGATIIRVQQFITQSGEFDVLLWAAPPGKNYTNITIGGVPQRKATYELSGRRVYFSGIPAGIPGEIQYYQVCSAGMAADILSEQHIPSGEQSTFRLRDYPLSKDHLFLHTNGHLYRSNEFSLDGRDITLNEPLASGEILEIRSVRAMAVLEVEDGTLTTPKYQDLSITSPKLAADIEISNLTAISSFVSEETARVKALSIPWAPNTPYVQGDIVVHLGTIYECQTGHQSTTSIVADTVYWNEIGGGGSGSSGVTKTILQGGHGFTKGQALRFNGAYGLAVADSWDNLAVCLVSEILDDSNFITTTAGYITGLSGLLPGAMHYLSPTIPGGLTPVRPSGIMQSMLFAITDSEGYVSMGAPSLVGQSIFRSQEFVIDDDVCVVDLNGQPPNGDYTFVHVGGVPQRPSDYQVVGKQIILSGYPVGISGEIRYVEVQNVGPGADIVIDSYVSESGQIVFPVSVPLSDIDRRLVDIRIGGIPQHQTSFLIDDNAVVTAEPLPSGIPVEVRTVRRLAIAEPAVSSVRAEHILSGEINSSHLSPGLSNRVHDIGDFKQTQRVISISPTNPWFKISNPTQTLSVVNYPEYVPFLREQIAGISWSSTPLSGTIQLTEKALTGSSTNFDPDIDVDDLLFISNLNQFRYCSGRTSDTAATVNEPGTASAGSKLFKITRAMDPSEYVNEFPITGFRVNSDGSFNLWFNEGDVTRYPENYTLLAALVEAFAFDREYGTLTFASTIGSGSAGYIDSGTYQITNIVLANIGTSNPVITCTGGRDAGNLKTSISSSISVYHHRIAGSETTARHYEVTDAAIMTDGLYNVLGLAQRDQFQGFGRRISNSNGAAGGVGTTLVSTAYPYTYVVDLVGSIITDNINETPRPGPQTRPRTIVANIYVYVGEFRP